MNQPPLTPLAKSILIVDDTLDNLRVLSSVLGKQGYQIQYANNGPMALMMVENTLPDLILLDVKMPDMNGYEVCRVLKANERTRHIPVMFLSALDDAVDKVYAFEVGGVDYITKPFDLAEMLIRVRHQLKLQTAHTEIKQLNAELDRRVQQRTAQLSAISHQLAGETAQREQIQRRLQDSEQRLESILNSLDNIVWSISVETLEIIYLNPAAERVYGRTASEFLAKPTLWLEVIHPDDRMNIRQALAIVREQGVMEGEYRILRPDGEVRWLSIRASLVADIDGKNLRLDGISYDITEHRQVQEKLLHDALHDTLTGLPNRALFMAKVDQALKQTTRTPEYLFAILFLDLDRFKLVNDSLGHIMGDRLLIEIARILKKCLRPTDTVARLGGDEFTVLLDRIHDINSATQVADRIQAELTSPLNISGQLVFMSVSIGILLGSSAYSQATDLLRDADIAMYHAKEHGRGCYEIFNHSMYTATLERLKLENDLRQALENQEFLVYYQPIIDLETNLFVGFEALIRWQHPQRGLVPPNDFIPVAEDSGLIVAIGEWVMKQACLQLRVWQHQFCHANVFKVAVNLSSQEFQAPNLLQKIDRILAETGLPGSCLRIEITESMLMDRKDETVQVLAQLRARQIQLSIDDFGQGYSSLSYLPRFRANTLKIDRSFTSQMTHDRENFAIVRTVITLAHSLNMNVIAEGVETLEQVTQLKALGCELAQGYLFSRPTNAEEMTTLIAANFQSVEAQIRQSA